MEINLKNVCYKELIINTIIDTKDIVGITGEDNKTILKLIALLLVGKGDIYYDKEKITKENRSSIVRNNSYISKEIVQYSFLDTVDQYMKYHIKKNQLNIKDPKKKIKDALRIVGLEKIYLNRKINELSKSEQKLVQIAIALLSNPENIFLEDPFLDLDIKNEKKVYRLLLRLKEQYHKTIMMTSNNSEKLYKYTEQMIFIKNKKILLSGKTEEVYLRVNFLTKNNFEIPDIIRFTYKAKKDKKAKIGYHKDVRDIIKDIYKHV